MDKVKRKEKILIVSHALELGGAERSLIGLLDAIDKEKYQVDLFLLRHQGELLDMIPDKVTLLPEIAAYTALARPLVQVLKERHVLLCAARMFGKIKALLYDKRHHFQDSGVALEYSHKYTCPLMPKIQPHVEYDVAISFLTPHYFVAKKVCARKKLAWIHTDYTNVSVNVESETAMWGAYGTIIAVSKMVEIAFRKVFTNVKSDIIVIENILPQKLIEYQSEEECEMDSSCFKILSIGRFCTAKNFDNVPDICRFLMKMGINVKWYLIGFGNDEALIRQKIKENGMQNRVIILGKKTNPYPYIKACDLYVQPSRYEGKCVSVKEAQMLGKPVVITAYSTSSSQLENGIDGIILPMDNEKCAAGIAELIKSKDKRLLLSHNCMEREYSNRSEVKKLYAAFERN